MDFLKRIDNVITWEDNQALIQLPSDEDVKTAVFELHPDSVAGPDGFNGKFFQVCWYIIAEDVCVLWLKTSLVVTLLTKYFTHTCLVLIPKVESPSTFSQLRPINLSNFSNKIISKIISNRLTDLLPSIISEN